MVAAMGTAAVFAQAAAPAGNAPAVQGQRGAAGAVEGDGPMLEGVREVVAPGTPGLLTVWGAGARVLVAGSEGGMAAPAVACGTLGGGRVAAFPHTGFLDAGSMNVADTGAMLDGLIRWAGRRDAGKGPQPRVAVLHADLGGWLASRGMEWVKLDGRDWAGQLSRSKVDVLCVSGNAFTPQQVAAMDRFVRSGGGLLAAQTCWAWAIPPGGSVRDNPLNRLFAPAGIAWTHGYSSKSARGTFERAGEPGPLLHAGAALDALEKFTPGAKPDQATREAAYTATTAARHLPAEDTLLRPRLSALLEAKGGAILPTPAAALTDKQPLERVLLAFQVSEEFSLPAEKVRAHPAAKTFPGAVPAGAARVASARVDVDLARSDWQSTGLYAPAGEVISVSVPPGRAAGRLRVRIGGHKDELWHLPKWERVPQITREWTLAAGENAVASPFGGLVYVDVPAGLGAGEVSLAVSGAVEAPLFVQGKTSKQAWIESIRQRPGPWAELATGKVIVTVPSEAVRGLDDPEALMAVWDRVLDAAADLATIARERARPERYTPDQQISAGYMHSGYPIMTHLDAVGDMVSAERLLGGCWGLFHELGHNHQAGEWTFDGTGEVTVNLFSLYIMETVCGKPMNAGHPALAERGRLVAKHRSKGATFEGWKSDPFLALVMYQQLREAFGWETYKRVFAEYRGLPADQRPKGEQQERDQWMVRFSRACGKNLGPFFEAWGVPTSPEARAGLADLPTWMPADWPGPG
jgi:hypothetical protein